MDVGHCLRGTLSLILIIIEDAEVPQGWAFWPKIFRPSRPSYEEDSIPFRGALWAQPGPRNHPVGGDSASILGGALPYNVPPLLKREIPSLVIGSPSREIIN